MNIIECAKLAEKIRHNGFSDMIEFEAGDCDVLRFVPPTGHASDVLRDDKVWIGNEKLSFISQEMILRVDWVLASPTAPMGKVRSLGWVEVTEAAMKFPWLRFRNSSYWQRESGYTYQDLITLFSEYGKVHGFNNLSAGAFKSVDWEIVL